MIVRMFVSIGTTVVCVASMICPAMAEPFHHPFGEWREYNRDWLAACPDVIDEDATDFYGFSCFASTGSQDVNSANHPAYKLTLMHNRLPGEQDVAIAIAADGANLDLTRSVRLSFGGDAPVVLAPDALETRYNTINQFYVVDHAQRDALIEKMRERNMLTMVIPLVGQQAATTSVVFSLRGVAASLDFMATYARRVTQY